MDGAKRKDIIIEVKVESGINGRDDDMCTAGGRPLDGFDSAQAFQTPIRSAFLLWKVVGGRVLENFAVRGRQHGACSMPKELRLRNVPRLALPRQLGGRAWL
jgi:hypothetical protein